MKKTIIVISRTIVFFFKILISTKKIYKRKDIVVKHMLLLGVNSLPLLFIAAIFVGAIAAESASYQFKGFVPNRYIGTAVGLSVILELAPIIMGILLAGRVSSGIAIEMASMKNNEELHVFKILNFDHFEFYGMPRLWACILMFPFLYFFFCLISLVSGGIEAYFVLNVTYEKFIYGLRVLFQPYFVFVGTVKVLVFAIIISVVGYYCGIKSSYGAKGVGFSSMRAVVLATVGILIFDFILTILLLDV